MNSSTIAQIVAVIILAGWTIYKELRDRYKRRKFGLLANPERCNQHASAINELREQVAELQECSHKIAEKVGIVL